MADSIKLPLSLTFVKVFDSTTNSGESYTIQNNTTVPITYVLSSSTPEAGATGFQLDKGVSGAILDISDDIYFRAMNERGSTLTYHLRESA